MSGATYQYYIILEVDGKVRSTINNKNLASRYEDPKHFGCLKAAKDWIRKHSYKGMSHSYQVIAVPFGDEALKVVYDSKEIKK